MAQRVALGCTTGGYGYFRVSKFGKSIWSTDMNDFLMHESFFSGMPLINATVTGAWITNTGTPLLPSYRANITITHGLGFNPFIVVSGNTSQVSVTFDASNVYISYFGYFTGTSGWISFPDGPLEIYVYGNSV